MNFERLNKSQQRIVTSTCGPIMVLASAGSGKTRTIVAKISYLIEKKGVNSFEILALTFSNKAAKEMRERVMEQLSVPTESPQVITFHSFCARILRREASYIGTSKSFTIYDKSESRSLIKKILTRHKISFKDIPPSELLSYIDGIKNHGHYRGASGDKVDKSEAYYGYYVEYEEELCKSNAIDFGGLIVGVLELFEKHPEVLKKYKKRFKYILVDEYQDTNRAQFQLIMKITDRTSNICVVGDEDQSIYSWRGAEIQNIFDFEKKFKDVQLLKLEQNYRSSKNITNAASHLISNNIKRKNKEMWTHNPDGESIKIIECASDREEANFISKEIKALKRDGVNNRDIAVFYRANSQSRIIEDYFRKERLVYRIVGGTRFYDRKEIKDLIAYLRVVVNERDSLSLTRIINVPTRGVGATMLGKLEGIATERNHSLWETVTHFTQRPTSYKIRTTQRVVSSLKEFMALIDDLKKMNQSGDSPSLIFEKALYSSGYWDSLAVGKDIESQARMENLKELASAIKEYEQMARSATLSGFLETITLDLETDQENIEQKNDYISLMTIHGAKGLEFCYVFVSGVEENIFPSYQSLEEGNHAIEEERRLFYVAMTRAMEKLYLTYSKARMLFGRMKYNEPGRFLAELPDHYCQHLRVHSFRKKETVAFSNGTFPKRESQRKKFLKGTPVAHNLYGKGVVIRTDGKGHDEKVLIKFVDGEEKKFMVKFAQLTKL